MSLTLTIDDAIARMFNVEQIPQGKTAVEVLGDIALALEDKLADAESQQLERLGQFVDMTQLEPVSIPLLRRKLEYAHKRFELAGIVMQDMEWEIEHDLDHSLLKVVSTVSGYVRLDYRSVAQWAKVNYGIGRFDYEELKFTGESNPKGDAAFKAGVYAKHGLSCLLAKGYLIVMAYLVEMLLDTSDRSVKRHSINSIAKDVTQRFYNDTGTDKSYGDKTVRNYLSIALSMKEQFGKINP